MSVNGLAFGFFFVWDGESKNKLWSYFFWLLKPVFAESLLLQNKSWPLF